MIIHCSALTRIESVGQASVGSIVLSLKVLYIAWKMNLYKTDFGVRIICPSWLCQCHICYTCFPGHGKTRGDCTRKRTSISGLSWTILIILKFVFFRSYILGSFHDESCIVQQLFPSFILHGKHHSFLRVSKPRDQTFR
jgi:hypothetical protein